MGNTPSAERRRHQRYPLATSIEFFHGPSRRDFPARCVDISEGGMLMYVPAKTPVQAGQPIRLNLQGVTRPDVGYMAEEPMDATVVRVDRQKLLSIGHVAVGVKFASV